MKYANELRCHFPREVLTENPDRLQMSNDQSALQKAENILPAVYDELRKLAAAKMARERSGHTLQPTALVHEAWLRLSNDASGSGYQDRAQFFISAAEAMRRILIESARRKGAQKRGELAKHHPLEEWHWIREGPSEEVLLINERLDMLAKVDPEAATLVKLRYFVGMTMREASAAMNISQRHAERLWTYAKARLRRADQSTASTDP